MFYLLIGDDLKAKHSFIEAEKNKLSSGLWGKHIEQLWAQEISSVSLLQNLLRNTSLAQEYLLIIWDIDRLKRSLQEKFISIVKNYVIDFQQLILIAEGKGEKGSFSSVLSDLFSEHSLTFGKLRENLNFFDLSKRVLNLQFAEALTLFDELRIDKFSFPQFLGALRVVMLDKVKQDSLRIALLDLFLNADITVKLHNEPVRPVFEDLMHKIKSLLSAGAHQ